MHRALPPALAARLIQLSIGAGLLTACASPAPPPPEPAPRPATAIEAPMSRTFAVAAEVMREDGAEIDVHDQATGTITTKELIIPYRYRGVASDCGEGSVPASQVLMTLRVTGDEQRSAVQVTGRYSLRGLGPIRYCTTKNFWEPNIEERIRDRAEGR